MSIPEITSENVMIALHTLADRGARKAFSSPLTTLIDAAGETPIDALLGLAMLGCEDEGEVELVGIFEQVLMGDVIAREFALESHKGQEYGAGRPYSVHLEAVAEILKPFGRTAVSIGYLHDIVEDTPVTLKQIREEFGPFVADCVALITDEPGSTRKERKGATYAKLASVSGDLEIALTVKAADRLANVRACIADCNERLLGVYQSEHEAFRQAAYRSGRCEALWQELDALIAKFTWVGISTQLNTNRLRNSSP